MAQYYYTVASLPLLAYDGEAAISAEEFLGICEREVGGATLKFLRAALVESGEPAGEVPRALATWSGWDGSLRLELARLRAHALGRELSEAESADEAVSVLEAGQIAREAFSQESPLQAEDALDRARWAFLDALSVGHYFDLHVLIVYALRLRILARRAFFTSELGRQGFASAYEAVTKGLIGKGPESTDDDR